jgi:Fur family ferric uptake transcriptional regulator
VYERQTRQKAAIREAFTEADRPLSTEEVWQGAQLRHPTLGIATVYRNIQTLVSEGWLQPVEIPGETTRYEVAGKEHHDHFQCNTCGKVFDLEGCMAPAMRNFQKDSRRLGMRSSCMALVPTVYPARLVRTPERP